MNINTLISLTAVLLSSAEASEGSVYYFKQKHAELAKTKDFSALRKEYRNPQAFKFLTKDDMAKLKGHGLCDAADELRYFDPNAISSLKSDKKCITSLFTKGGAYMPFVNGLKRDFVKENPGLILIHVGSQIHLLKDDHLKAILDTQEGRKKLTEDQFFKLLESKRHASLFTSKVFSELEQVHDAALSLTAGIRIRNLPETVFASLENGLDASWFEYMSEAQMKNFQSKIKKDDFGKKSILKLDSVGAQAVGVIPPAVLAHYLKVYKGHIIKMKKDSFWKRIQPGAFKAAIMDDDYDDFFGTIPPKALQAMTLEQRQVIIDALAAKENCKALSADMFLGKPEKYNELRVSTSCFKDIKEGTDGHKTRYRVLVGGLTPAESALDIEATEISKLAAKIQRHKREPFPLSNMCTYEFLSQNKLGTEYMANILKEDAEEKCANIDLSELKKCHWLQEHLTPECIQGIKAEMSFDTVKKMDANIWAGMSWKQIKNIVKGDREEWSKLLPNSIEGLSRNKEFAEKALKVKAKEDKEDESVPEDLPIITSLPAEQVGKYFGWKFVNNVPSEHHASLGTHFGLLGNDALSGASGDFVRHTMKDAKFTEAQIGHASDDIEEARSYPATVTIAEVEKMPISQVSLLSETFLSHMKPASISAFSAEQVQALQPASFSKLCGDKLAALKHELSPEQKAALPANCEGAAVEATSDAACPYSAQSILAMAAAAAGSAALLL